MTEQLSDERLAEIEAIVPKQTTTAVLLRRYCTELITALRQRRGADTDEHVGTRTKLIREQQRSPADKVTAVMVSPSQPDDDKLHIAVCQAVQMLTDGNNYGAGDVLRQALWDYSEPAPTDPYTRGLTAGLEMAAKVAHEIKQRELHYRDTQYHHEIAWTYNDIGARIAGEVETEIRRALLPAPTSEEKDK